jgi:hypothetical protein
MVGITIHHGGVVQHNPGLTYVGGMTDFIEKYDIDFLSVWEIEDLVRDLGYVNDLRYWYKIDDSDMDELGKPLTNDEQVVDFLNIVEIYKLEGVHIYVEYRVDVPDIIREVLLLPPAGPHPDEPDGDVQNGHVNEYANVGNVEGDAENVEGVVENVVGVAENAESFPEVDGNVGHAEMDYIYMDVQVEETASKTSKKKAAKCSKKKAFVRKPKAVGEKKRGCKS